MDQHLLQRLLRVVHASSSTCTSNDSSLRKQLDSHARRRRERPLEVLKSQERDARRTNALAGETPQSAAEVLLLTVWN